MDFTIKIMRIFLQNLQSSAIKNITKWCSIIVLLAILSSGAGYSFLGWADEGRPTVPSITIKAEVIEQTTISVKEPVIVRVTVTNTGAKSIYLPVGTGASGLLHFAISDPNGQIVGQSPPKALQGGLVAVKKLAPNEQWVGLKTLSDWYIFDRPGKYQVQVQRLAGNPAKAIAEDKFQLNVVPYMSSRVEARCLQLFAHIAPSFRRITPQIAGLNQNIAMQALLSIRDEVALPYFDYLAKEYSSVGACLAIRRVDTKRAERLIKALAARQDNVGKAARQALKLPLEKPKPEQSTITD